MFRIVATSFKPVLVRSAVSAEAMAVRGVGNRWMSSTAENAEAPKEGEAAKPANGEQGPTHEAQLAKLQEEVKDLKDQVLRAYAESENTRRIAHRDVENARAYANSSFAKAVLEVSDDLERALSVVPVDKRNQADKTMKTLIDGIEMTEKNLQKILGKFGIVKFGEVNDKFDPNIHDALFQIPDANSEADTVGQIVKMGYKIKDRVLRPAQVGTRVKPSS